MKTCRILWPVLLLAACPILAAEKARLIEKANVLPLALSDDFSFRKMKTFHYDPRDLKATQNPVIQFERQRVLYGAVTQSERRQRYGHYYNFFWRTSRAADVTVRFEYRQEKLGGYVQAKELFYPKAKGSVQSDFQLTGDDYEEDGKITAWRAVVIESGRIVALTQSFNWN